MTILLFDHALPAPQAFLTFLADLSEAKLYAAWRRDNPGEAQRWDSLLANPSQPLPQMKTPFGRALVQVAALAYT